MFGPQALVPCARPFRNSSRVLLFRPLMKNGSSPLHQAQPSRPPVVRAPASQPHSGRREGLRTWAPRHGRGTRAALARRSGAEGARLSGLTCEMPLASHVPILFLLTSNFRSDLCGLCGPPVPPHTSLHLHPHLLACRSRSVASWCSELSPPPPPVESTEAAEAPMAVRRAPSPAPHGPAQWEDECCWGTRLEDECWWVLQGGRGNKLPKPPAWSDLEV